MILQKEELKTTEGKKMTYCHNIGKAIQKTRGIQNCRTCKHIPSQNYHKAKDNIDFQININLYNLIDE